MTIRPEPVVARRVAARVGSCNTKGCSGSIFVFEVDTGTVIVRFCKQCLAAVNRQAREVMHQRRPRG